MEKIWNRWGACNSNWYILTSWWHKCLYIQYESCHCRVLYDTVMSQLNCWSLRCSWSIACRRCSNYIFVLRLTPGFNILRKHNCKSRREIILGFGASYIRYLLYLKLHRRSSCGNPVGTKKGLIAYNINLRQITTKHRSLILPHIPTRYPFY